MYYKILNKDLCHNGFQYKLGLNEDILPFNPSGSCRSGGLYFTDLDNVVKFLSYGCYIAEVSLPDGEEIYKDPEGNKYKARRITIDKYCPTKEWKMWEDKEFCLAAVQQDGRALQYVKEQTPEICLAAVQKNGSALEFVKEQTPEICLAAVQKYGRALRYVKEQTPEICLAAVQKDGSALEFVKEKK